MIKTGRKPLLIFAITAMVFAVRGLAQETTLSATLSAKQVLVGENFTWTVQLEGSQDLPSISAPKPKKVAVVAGPMQSSNYSVVNGAMSATRSVAYTYTALETGTVIFPEQRIRVGRKTMTIPAQSIQIVAAKSNKSGTASASPNVFIRAIPSKTEVVAGEPILVQFKLFTKVGVSNYQFDKEPDAVGFWAEEIESKGSPRLVSEIIDGERYRTAVLKRMLYAPTKTGTLVIDPLVARIEVDVQTSRKSTRFNDPFFNDPFFGGTRQEYRVFKTEPLKIQVNALPEPKPADFTGGVGEFTFKASLDTNAVFANDAVGLTLILRGTGNLKSIKLPEPVLPEDIDAFKPERSESIKIEGDRYRGEKRATYLLVPRKAGNIVLQPMEFTYYHPVQKRYVTKSTGFIKLSVRDNDKSGTVVTSGYSREEVALMQDDIRYIKAVPSRMKSATQGLGWMYWTVHVLALVLVVSSFVYEQYQRRLDGNEGLRRRTSAMSIARKKVKQARGIEETDAFQQALASAVTGFIGARLNIAENALDHESFMAELKNRELPDEVLTQLDAYLIASTLDRYAPGAVEQSREAWLSDTEALLQTLGKHV